MTPNTPFQKPVRLFAGAENVLISTASRLHSLLTRVLGALAVGTADLAWTWPLIP